MEKTWLGNVRELRATRAGGYSARCGAGESCRSTTCVAHTVSGDGSTRVLEAHMEHGPDVRRFEGSESKVFRIEGAINEAIERRRAARKEREHRARKR